ncbi:precorrin-6A/cobalt-precorrin-6A reductase [uncultured Roseobacter sp.]|uniref:precorrin-6A/cobalt-precorrin-6A reductase n=1 Tax=uncultured Roseobacter sp. TaxID=114847 RepID=UPI00260DD547|nr:precorrin-6A/cobalt-precorrin-6A reductase [uncultured Roseobacter sp.]
MRNAGSILVMGGAREAHGLVSRLKSRGRSVVASLPEPERVFEPLPVPTRVGAFEDNASFEAWVDTNNVVCVLDASHAFDAEVSRRAALVATRLNLRYLRVLRPPWRASGQDYWTDYRTVRKASEDIQSGERVFSNTGRASLPEFETFAGQVLFLRQTQAQTAPPPYDFVRYVTGTPPFSQHSEEALFQTLRISRLICRNVGGSASISKLLAARRLGLRVAMVARPEPPTGVQVVETVTEALAWEADA